MNQENLPQPGGESPAPPLPPATSPDSPATNMTPLPATTGEAETHSLAATEPAAGADSAFVETAAMLGRIREQVQRVFLGQSEVVDQVLTALVTGGHILLEGKPGLGKTHLVIALARTFGGQFARIQFTPDLMPSDVTGHTIYEMGTQSFRVRKGPVFTNLLLADEINRAPAKTQSALLEVMQEVQVTIDGDTHKLDPPFMTLATQNPIEQEGTYPLPEAQLDRFLMKVLIDYPSAEEEATIVSLVSAGASGSGLSPSIVQRVCEPEDILRAQMDCAAVQAVDSVVKYAIDIVRATRESQGISLGAGTRGAISLIRVAKGYAILNGRNYVIPADVKSAVLPVLRHRISLAPELAISGQQVDDTLASLVASIEAPRQ